MNKPPIEEMIIELDILSWVEGYLKVSLRDRIMENPYLRGIRMMKEAKLEEIRKYLNGK